MTPSSERAGLITAIDPRLLAFTFLLTLLTVVACGLLPAIRLAVADVYTSLNGGRRVTETAQSRKILIAAQVALSLVLLASAGLFTRTLANLLSSYTGSDPTNVLVTRLTLQDSGDEKSPFPASSDLLREVRSFPGLDYASLSSSALFAADAQFRGVRTTTAGSPPANPVYGTVLRLKRLFFDVRYPIRGRARF